MTLLPQDQSSHPKIPSGLADYAALFVTFYGAKKQDGMRRLVDWLVDKLHLERGQDVVGGESWSNPNALPDPEVYLYLFHPNAIYAHDTDLVQLVLTEPGDASKTWQNMYDHLMGNKIDLKEILIDLSKKDVFWGYTIVYQAVLTQPQLQEPEISPPPLAQAKIMQGHLWLLDIPMGEEGIDAAMVYIALVPEDQNNPLVEKVLIGTKALLLPSDLIAHKGYYYIRQYRVGDRKEEYENLVHRLNESLHQVLNNSKHHTQESIKYFDKLKIEFTKLIKDLPTLDTIRIAIRQQMHNYNRWHEPTLEDGNLLNFHYQWLETGNEELQLLIELGRSALEAANTTVSIVQKEIDERQEDRENRREKEEDRRERKLETILAMIGIGLAIAQVVDTDTANKILGIPWVSCENLRMLTWDILTCQYISEPWRPLAVKTFMTLIPFIIWFIIQTLLYLLPRHEQHESPK